MMTMTRRDLATKSTETKSNLEIELKYIENNVSECVCPPQERISRLISTIGKKKPGRDN